MNKYLKEFLHRGLMFSGLGPIVLGIVYFILSLSLPDFSLGGGETLIAIVSTYIIAFIQAGVSVFNQIEHWPIAKSLLCHFSILYITYLSAYALNSWIPFEPTVIFIFTAIFIVTYLTIWLSVYFAVRATSNRFNRKLQEKI